MRVTCNERQECVEQSIDRVTLIINSHAIAINCAFASALKEKRRRKLKHRMTAEPWMSKLFFYFIHYIKFVIILRVSNYYS